MTSKSDILVSKCRLSENSYPDEDFAENEEDMTLGVGFRCKDGILIAGDMQRTKGQSAQFVTKVQEFSHYEDFSGVFIGAGSSSCVDMMFSDIENLLHDFIPLKKIIRAIDEVSGRVYKKHEKLPARAKKKEPRFSSLIGLWSQEEGCKLILAGFDTPAHVVNADYKSIGSGALLADCLVKTFYSRRRFDGSCEDAAIISAMVLKLVKEFDPSCGGGTNIIAVMNDGTLVTPKSGRATEHVEEWFGKFLDTLKQIFSSVSVKQDFKEIYGEALGTLKSDLKTLVEEHHQNPLLIRRFPRPFTKTDFEQALRKVSRRIRKPEKEQS
jgi:hypothetical protein